MCCLVPGCAVASLTSVAGMTRYVTTNCSVGPDPFVEGISDVLPLRMPIVFSTGGVSISSGPGKYLFIHSCDTVMVDPVHW